MIRGNVLGFGIAMVGGLFGGMCSYFLHLQDQQALMLVGIVWMCIDGIARLQSLHQPRWLLSRLVGGHLWYIPMWVFGFLLVLINATVLLAN